MNKSIEYLYYKSPVFLQNIATTFYGMNLYLQRYSRQGKIMLSTLKKTQDFDKDQMRQYQEYEFVKIARHAISTTEFYHNWAKENGIAQSDIRSLKDIKMFPVVDKEMVRSNPDSFKSSLYGKKVFEIHTSGTTGTPLRVFTDIYSRSRHYAFFSRLRSWNGVNPVDRRCTIMGRVITLPGRKKPPFWRYDLFQKNLLMSSYHLNEENLFYYYEKIKSYNPKEILSYPSSIYTIAKFIVDNKLDPIDVNVVITTAETLLPYQAECVSRAFNTTLINQYGCTEMSFFASSQDNIMLLHPEHGLAEVENDKGEIDFHGEGKLIATGFINYSMPIIRYSVGDSLILSDVNDNGAQKIISLEGRTDDILYSYDNTPIGRLDPIFKGGLGIKEAQIEQLSDKSVVLRLVPDKEYDSEKGDSLKSELSKRLGREIPVNIEICNQIGRGSNGKFKPVISSYEK